MTLSRLSVLASCLVLSTLAASADPIRRAASPALSPNGDTVVFSWQGDVWTVPAGGGPARRLTVHPARDTMPRFTPDGKSIVFVSNRFGSGDVFVMDATGGNVRRLNHESSNEQITSISPDGKHVYGYSSLWGGMDVFRLPLAGGDLVRLTGRSPDQEFEYYPALTANGTSLVFNSGGSPAAWRKPNLRGSNTAEIWVADLGTPARNFRNLTKNEVNDFFPNPLPDGDILFVSNRAGTPNVFRMNGDGSGVRQVTRHTKGTARWLSVAANGESAVYEQDSDVWVLDLKTNVTRRLAIEAPDDGRVNPVTELTLTTNATDFVASPNGRRMVAVIRGDLWLMPERGGTTRRLTTSLGLDNQPVWLDDKTILFVTGRNGKRELMTVTIDGAEKPFLSDALDLSAPVLSPDGKTIALHRGHNEIVTVPAAGGTPAVVVSGFFTDGLRGAPAFSWSPDSAYLAMEVPNSRGSTIQLVKLADRSVIEVTRTPRGGSTPVFLPNGKGLLYELVDEDGVQLRIVDLAPLPVEFTEDDLDRIDEKKEEKKEPVAVQVVLDGLMERDRLLGAASSPVPSADSKTVWAVTEDGLVTIPVAGGPATPVPNSPLSVRGLRMNKAGNRLYFTQGGRIFGLNTAGGAPTPINFSANLVVNLKDEERALFTEIVWALERFYYDPKLHGKDWNEIKSRYAATAAQAVDRDDFYATVGEMVEELDSSHMGATAPMSAPPVSEQTGYLGVEWNPTALDARGRYEVGWVMPGSPAAQPDSLLKVEDRVLKVDGVAPTAQRPMAALLSQRAGKRVNLTVERDSREITVSIRPAPLAAVASLNDAEWVRWNRRTVDQLSGGRVAYLYYASMDQASQDRFLREIRTLTPGKDGVIIDVRYNGGGFTAHLALGVLIKTPWLDRTFRGFDGIRVSENVYRGDSLELPSSLMTNQYSFSNAEIFSEGFRRLKVGTVVGERTAGGVIGTSAWGLWDGGSIRMPSNGAYTIDGENLEGNGRRPDLNVPFDMNLWLAGRDPMLERAVEDLLRRMPKRP